MFRDLKVQTVELGVYRKGAAGAGRFAKCIGLAMQHVPRSRPSRVVGVHLGHVVSLLGEQIVGGCNPTTRGPVKHAANEITAHDLLGEVRQKTPKTVLRAALDLVHVLVRKGGVFPGPERQVRHQGEVALQR